MMKNVRLPNQWKHACGSMSVAAVRWGSKPQPARLAGNQPTSQQPTARSTWQHSCCATDVLQMSCASVTNTDGTQVPGQYKLAHGPGPYPTEQLPLH